MNARTAVIAAVLCIALTACNSPTPPTGPTRSSTGASVAPVPVAKMLSPTLPAPGPGGHTAARAAGHPPLLLAQLLSAITVDDKDPSSVALAVVITTNQSDTRTDTSSRDALARAGRWLTPELLAGSLAVPDRTDSTWTTLVDHRGFTTVDHVELANEYGQPADTSTTAWVQISYQERKFGRDGWRSSRTRPLLARVRLVKTGARWQVNAFD